MGIQDLFSIIDSYAPNSMFKLHISDLSGFTVAIDINIYFYQFVRGSDAIIDGKMSGSWFDKFVKMMIQFKDAKIQPIFIFEGQAPIDKKDEQDERRMNENKILEKIQHLKDFIVELTELRKNGVQITPIELQNNIKQILLNKRNSKTDSTNYANVYGLLNTLKSKLQSLQTQSIPITSHHTSSIQKLISLFGWTWLQANGEAEELACYLCLNGQCNAVLSNDTDVLAYSCPFFVTKYDVWSGSLCGIDYDIMLNELKLTKSEFLDLCILLGCDYNKRVKGYGPQKCMDLIQKYKTIERIIQEYFVGMDVESLNYIRCRELFMGNTNPSYENHEPIHINISELLQECQSSYTLDKLQKYLT